MLFLVVVVLPTAAACFYYLAIASDQYVSESRFGIRAAEMQRNDASSLFAGGMASASQIGLDSNVVVQYVHSREIVDALEQRLGLRALFQRAEIDRLSRLPEHASAEQVVNYWRGMVDPFFDVTTGSISLRVKAFAPADALRLNEEILRLSEALVNEMSRRAREDAVRLANDEVEKAAARMRKIRQAILEFRDRERLLDPKKQSETSIGLISKLREELAKATAELSTNRFYMSDNSPAMVALANRVRGLQEQVAAAEASLTNSGDQGSKDGYSRTVGGFEALETERIIAEKTYGTVVDAAQRAQEAANRQATYLSVFVRPALPEAALYPKRLQSIVLVLLGSLGAWILLVIAVHSIREHT